MTAWKTIDTAPKDKTEIDVWIITKEDPIGRRVPNASRIYDGGKYPDVWVDRTSHYINCSYYWDREEEDDCIQLGNTPHPNARRWTKVTHWMPTPAGPNEPS